MNLSAPKDAIKIIKRNDPEFSLVIGGYAYPRAGFQINHCCPDDYKELLLKCIKNEWITPVAYMKQSEYVWEKLGE